MRKPQKWSTLWPNGWIYIQRRYINSITLTSSIRIYIGSFTLTEKSLKSKCSVLTFRPVHSVSISWRFYLRRFFCYLLLIITLWEPKSNMNSATFKVNVYFHFINKMSLLNTLDSKVKKITRLTFLSGFNFRLFCLGVTGNILTSFLSLHDIFYPLRCSHILKAPGLKRVKAKGLEPLKHWVIFRFGFDDIGKNVVLHELINLIFGAETNTALCRGFVISSSGDKLFVDTSLIIHFWSNTYRI